MMENLKQIVEATLLAAARPLSIDQLLDVFEDSERPDRREIREVLKELAGDYEGRGMELSEIGSGFRIQVRQQYANWVSRLWEEKPARYSRALMETLALIAYRQPITRGEIEEIRGVSVSSNIVKTLLERDWVRVVGHRDVPGRPSLYSTTRHFLDYFNMRSLDQLPTLAEIRDLDSINRELELESPDSEQPTEAGQDEIAASASEDNADVDGEYSIAQDAVEDATTDMSPVEEDDEPEDKDPVAAEAEKDQP